jgi:hypothetical protein
MRSRMIDIALLVGLVAVAGGILWTLFTLGREPRVARTPPPPPAATSPATPSSTPGAAAGDAAGNRGVVAIDPDEDDEPGAANGAAGDVAAAGDADARGPGPNESSAVSTPAAPAAPPRVLPSGTLELERVGYSFVTGGAGACGVVLEPWTHVAVSRDLLETFGCGAEVTVTLDDPVEGRTEVVGVIGDTMNPSHSMTVNVYVAEDEPALDYGLTTGTFRAR